MATKKFPPHLVDVPSDEPPGRLDNEPSAPTLPAKKFRVAWDNGASACGVFPYEFDSYEDADAYGREWADESNLRDFGTTDPDTVLGDAGYSYEVVS